MMKKLTPFLFGLILGALAVYLIFKPKAPDTSEQRYSGQIILNTDENNNTGLIKILTGNDHPAFGIPFNVKDFKKEIKNGTTVNGEFVEINITTQGNNSYASNIARIDEPIDGDGLDDLKGLINLDNSPRDTIAYSHEHGHIDTVEEIFDNAGRRYYRINTITYQDHHTNNTTTISDVICDGIADQGNSAPSSSGLYYVEIIQDPYTINLSGVATTFTYVRLTAAHPPHHWYMTMGLSSAQSSSSN